MEPVTDIKSRKALESAKAMGHRPWRYFEETDTNFAIGWKGNYQINGDAFVFIDRDTARVTILGYPTRRLAQVA
jgi:hypothetical protein